MKKAFLSLIAVLSMALCLAAGSLSTAYAAYTCGTDSNGDPVETSIDFTMGGTNTMCNAKGASPITALLLWVIGFMAGGVGIAVVIGIIFGGITYAMSDGDEGKAKEGREIIANAIIGLFLFIFLWAAANFIIPGGVFTT